MRGVRAPHVFRMEVNVAKSVRKVRFKALVSAVYQTPQGLPATLIPNHEYVLPKSMVDPLVASGHARLVRTRDEKRSEE